jgi:uncharacterized protein with NRDE domain
MCVILLSLEAHPQYRVIIAANRDEYYDRPTSPAAFWEEAPFVLAGRDLQEGGTWLGITKKGRFGAITNYRDPAARKEGAPSRGRLLSSFLLGKREPFAFIEDVKKESRRYNGFNLIVGERGHIFWYSNRGDDVRGLSPGIYALSNHLLDTPWPKVTRGKEALRRLLRERKDPSPEEFFHILQDHAIANDESLPATGVDLEWERTLSPIFVTSSFYGTRSSTLLLIDMQDRVTFIERTFASDLDQGSGVTYEFTIEP